MRRFAALAVLFLVSWPGYVRAQSSGASVTGYISDPAKAFIAGAKVIVINMATNARYEVATDNSGSYYITSLPPGTYRIEVERPGFKTVIKSDVVLHVQDTIAINFEMALGSVSEIVTVKAGAPPINTTDGSVSTVVDRQFVSNLPLNGRSFQTLILLSPGVVITPATGGNLGQFSVNGQRANANYFTVDGVSANASFTFGNGGSYQAAISQQLAGAVPGLSALGTTGTMVSIDALQEFKIQTSTYSAEYGRQPGGQVQLVTRSGTNDLHGTVFDYLRNDVFDARDWFNKVPAKKPPLRQNDFGGTLGGPVLIPGRYNGRNRTFFFFSYEGLRLRLPTTRTFNVPSLRLRQVAAPGVKPLLDIFPIPTGPENLAASGVPTGMAPFVGAYSSPKSTEAISIRIDHIINNRLRLFGRYNDAPSSGWSRDLMALNGDHEGVRALTVGSTASFTSRLANDFRMNYSQTRDRYTYWMDNYGGAVPIDPSLLRSGYSGPGAKLGRVIIQLPGWSFAPALGDQQDTYQRQTNILDNISWGRGAHQLKFGADYRRLAPTYGPTAYSEMINFQTEAQIVSGTAGVVRISASQGARPRFNNYSFYGVDHWMLTPRLSLDLGIRWEVNPAPHDANGVQPILVTGIHNTDVSQATLAPPHTPFYNTFWTALAPRIGLAYQLNQRSGRETVLRGGFGVYHDLGNGEAVNGFSVFPFNAHTVLHDVAWPLSQSLAVPPPFPTVTLPIANTLYAINPHLALPYTLQWNVALEQAIGQQQSITISYVASAARRELITETLNQAPINPYIFPRPNLNFGDINYVTNGPTADYHSLQLQYRRRLSHGLQALGNYTWSHAIDSISNEFSGGLGDIARGSADFDVRQNVSAAITYDLPRIPGAGWGNRPLLGILRGVGNGWSLDSIFLAQSGTPIDLYAGAYISPGGTYENARPDLVPGVGLWVHDSTVPGGQRLNPAAFQLPPVAPNDPWQYFLARQGTLGRNVVRGYGIYQVNLAIGRRINFGDRWSLKFKAEVFNVLNHPLFGSYDYYFYPGSTTLGVPSSTLASSLGGLTQLYQVGGPRSMQLSLKLSF